MLKPKDFESVQAYGDYTPVEPGGHILEIKSVEEKQARTGSSYLVVNFDMARDDVQAGYYADQYKRDTRTPKKWGGFTFVFPADRDGNTTKAFKTFCTSVEESNNASIQWGDGFANWFKGKRIGGVFGKEEYEGNDGNIHTATKLFWFRGVDAIKRGVEVPAERKLEPTENTNLSPFGFTEIEDDELPF